MIMGMSRFSVLFAALLKIVFWTSPASLGGVVTMEVFSSPLFYFTCSEMSVLENTFLMLVHFKVR